MNWLSEARADEIAKGRLEYLRAQAVQAIKDVNATPGEGQHNFAYLPLHTIVKNFTLQLHDGCQIDDVRKLRIEYRREQRKDETLYDWARRLLGGMRDNIERELSAIEQRTNFRLAIFTAAVAVVSTLISAIGTLISALTAIFK